MRFLTWGLIISLLISVLYVTWFSDDLQQGIQDADLKKEKPVILQNPELFDFKHNRLTMQVKAKTARVYESRSLTLLTTIDGNVYSEDAADKPTQIFAESGRIKGQVKLLTVWGNVRVLFSDGQQLFTEKLNLDQNKGMLYNRVAVRVVSDKELITAAHMQYNLKTGILTLANPKAAIESGF
jgi:LPS export ABC transporter protein LptC